MGRPGTGTKKWIGLDSTPAVSGEVSYHRPGGQTSIVVAGIFPFLRGSERPSAYRRRRNSQRRKCNLCNNFRPTPASGAVGIEAHGGLPPRPCRFVVTPRKVARKSPSGDDVRWRLVHGRKRSAADEIRLLGMSGRHDDVLRPRSDCACVRRPRPEQKDHRFGPHQYAQGRIGELLPAAVGV